MLLDIDVVCAPGADADCTLLALTSGVPEGKEIRLSLEANAATDQGTSTWSVATDWLQEDNEEVGSIAVNPSCVGIASSESGSPVRFLPQQLGCVDVGTTTGRILQLRSKASDPDSLVPGRVIHQKGTPSSRGSLSLLTNGVVLKLEPGVGGKVTAFGS